MKPPPLRYVRPASLDDAVRVLADAGDDAKVLAGGQSLVPMLNLRLARTSVLVDVTRIADLTAIGAAQGGVEIGASVRQHAAATTPLVRERVPLVARAIAHIGHPQIRTRGTVGGSIAHADPAAELAAVALALEARLRVASVRGARELDAREFFAGPYMTALEADEILVSAAFPSVAGARTALLETAHRSGDFALAGVAVSLELDGEIVRAARVAGFGVGPTPVRVEAAERALAGQRLSAEVCREAAEAAADSVEPFDGPHASASYRRRLFGVLVDRALREAR
jgi:carbon-monoxide dehydrogenase medium subunit